MRALLAPDILRMWEIASRQRPIDRALTLLTGARPESSAEHLAALSISERDAQLLDLRRRTFGETLNGFCECPQCATHLEICFNAAEIQSTSDIRLDGLEVESHGVAVRFRLPNSVDLAEAISLQDTDRAREVLFRRCISEARRGDAIIAPDELPLEVREEVNRRMAELDPAAVVKLNLQCPSCSHSWQVLFDIAAFFWAEISAHARRLIREVDALGRAYGWSEAEILNLSSKRRQAYLELIER